MDITNKKVGIWGFGLMGKSALNYLTKMNNTCQVLDNRLLTLDEHDQIKCAGSTLVSQNEIDHFMRNNDYILASPGIDIAPYNNKKKFICELDLFGNAWQKPIIAITGTVGKTTITTLLGKVLAKRYKVAVGGNIGTPMLDLLENQNEMDIAILELSSWQLEHAQTFRPHIAIISNISPNHLDRHKTMDNYINAKLNILQNQTQSDIAILPVTLKNIINQSKIHSSIKWLGNPSNKHNHPNAPKGTFKQNWEIIFETLNALNLPHNLIENINIKIEHRLEYIGIYNHIAFYNDSKSTTPKSTLAAVKQFNSKHLILILGGLSKGIDRSPMIEQLPKNIKHVICFGRKADNLHNMCLNRKLSVSSFDNLQSALIFCMQLAQPQDVILFSPSGSSFDLYENYKERGNHFKQLVTSF